MWPDAPGPARSPGSRRMHCKRGHITRPATKPENVPRNIFRHQATGCAPEEGERGHVGGHPGPLVHLQDRADEHVPGVRQDHDERPHPTQSLKRRVEPRAQELVVDLSFFPRRHLWAGRGGQLPGPVLGELPPHIAPEAGQADSERDRWCTVVTVLVRSISAIWARWALIASWVGLRWRGSTSSGNHSLTSAAHCDRDRGGPPGARPAALAGATYLLTVPRSTPRLRATTAILRPACQCIRISTMSLTWNALLVIASPARPG